MVILQMDKNSASSPRERAKALFDKVLTSLSLSLYLHYNLNLTHPCFDKVFLVDFCSVI